MWSVPIELPFSYPLVPEYTGELPQFPTAYTPVIPQEPDSPALYYHLGSDPWPPFHPVSWATALVVRFVRDVVLRLPRFIFGIIITWLRVLVE
jgi:hypothetical protein